MDVVPVNPSPANINKGLWLGLLGIVIFSVTLPMTRLAVGTPDAPQMSGMFIALGRAVVGGLALATLATLFVLPSAFAILASRKVSSPSLDPEDSASGCYEPAK